MTSHDLPDQHALWTAAYEHPGTGSATPSAFLAECLPLLAPGSRVLELGCGPGLDAAAFADAGHRVTALDFAANVIAANRERYADVPGLRFVEGRIDAPLPFGDGVFDAVYAHLTLHYYRDAVTRAIFAEIRRVLTPGGWLLFACKSPGDPAWGRGVAIEPDLFDLNGKVRHFFSEGYARSLLAPGFREVEIASHTGRLYGARSAWVTVIANTT